MIYWRDLLPTSGKVLHGGTETDNPRYRELPETPLSELDIQYHCGYWDGMLSGVVRHGDTRYYCVCVDEIGFPRQFRDRLPDEDEEAWYEAWVNWDNSFNWHRRYALLELTEAQWANEDHWHALFEEHVGTHTRYVGNERVRDGAKGGDWGKFYEPAKNRPLLDLGACPVIGWFRR